MSSSYKQVEEVDTLSLYNRWAKVYDTDGNILQSLDDALFPPLLHTALSLLSSPTSTPTPISITELGTGTGRNTSKLLSPTLFTTFPSLSLKTLTCLDLSPSMLSLASSRCLPFLSSLPQPPIISFHEFNALEPTSYLPLLSTLTGAADLVISTLVLEHLPLATFFGTCAGFLRKGGVLVVTNMHAEMGGISQAGFVDGGVKVRGESFVYGIQEVVEEGRKWGFEVVGEMGERGVEEEDVGGLVGERGRKWVGVNCWFGGVMRFNGNEGE